MAKGFNNRGMGDFGGDVNISMMKRVQEMQQDMMRVQQGPETKIYTVVAGDGMVSITMTDRRGLREVAIVPEAVDPEDVEMPRDMTVATMNEALRAAESDSAPTMQQLIGEFDLPS